MGVNIIARYFLSTVQQHISLKFLGYFPLNPIVISSNTKVPIILEYHGTPKNDPKSRYSIRADRFYAHLRYLKKQGWSTVLFRDIHDIPSLPGKTVVLTFDDGYADNYDGAFLPLVENDMKATWFITTDSIGKHAHWLGSASPQIQMLTIKQLLQMEKAGMEIGSHTCSHPNLTMLSYQQQFDEMIKSKQIIESLIHNKVSSFCFPYGNYNTDSIVAAQAADYKQGCAGRPRGFDSSEKNPLLYRRVPIFANDSVSTLARKLAFAQWYYLPPRKKMLSYFCKHISKINWLTVAL